MTCPVPGCDVQKVNGHVLCHRHWGLVPLPLRNTIWRLWRQGKPAPGYNEALASGIEQVGERMGRFR